MTKVGERLIRAAKEARAIAKAIAGERRRCIEAIKDWPGLSNDEKRIAIMAITKNVK